MKERHEHQRPDLRTPEGPTSRAVGSAAMLETAKAEMTDAMIADFML